MFPTEKYDYKLAIGCHGASSQDSQPFSLKGVSKVAVICGINAARSTVLATAVAGATFSVVVGKSSDEISAMTLLTGATLELGQKTLGQLNNFECVYVGAETTVPVDRYIIIDGTTITGKVNSSVGDKNYLTSACSAMIHSLVSNIATHCTHLETFGLVTAGDATVQSGIYIRRKDSGVGMAQGFSVSVSANASSSDQVFICPIKQNGVIEFTPQDVLATNSSYTHFGVVYDAVGTLLHGNAYVVREFDYNTTMVNRTTI